MSKVSDAYLRPSNTEYMVCPRVNSEVWGLFSERTQKLDRRYQELEAKYLTGMFPIVTAIKKCDCAEIKDLLMDSLMLLSNAHINFNFVRRGEMRLDMKKARSLDYK